MTAIKDALRDFGLTPREIDVYLAMLPVGTSHASTIASRTGMKRSTAQYTCQQLARRGLLAKSQRKNTYLYSVEPPEKMLSMLQMKQNELKSKEEQMNRVLGALKSMVNPSSVLPKVQFFEGRDGMHSLYTKILDIGERIDAVEGSGQWRTFMPETAEFFQRTRIKRGIPYRVVCPSGTVMHEDESDELREMLTLEAEEFPFTCDIKLCGPMASIFSFDEHTAVGIAIRHEDIVRNFHLVFDHVWKILSLRDKLMFWK